MRYVEKRRRCCLQQMSVAKSALHTYQSYQSAATIWSSATWHYLLNTYKSCCSIGGPWQLFKSRCLDAGPCYTYWNYLIDGLYLLAVFTNCVCESQSRRKSHPLLCFHYFLPTSRLLSWQVSLCSFRNLRGPVAQFLGVSWNGIELTELFMSHLNLG